ncbi:sigma-70 family RNA polymerase sigma factor [Ornithinibacillus halotolerans]|uniref:RNA polymerase sigma factor n=1 Tax=Ornithinibacillus halotolerans TaxID=1274357 RepID=A0A916WBL7_9BACI|nr:sigma-70 family RNA polymerase sigma factor [Ornithinibacillus halotolerans]GGA83360.1 RNA polymerase subunit sigma [Ornithinibacillus halotolerans]
MGHSKAFHPSYDKEGIKELQSNPALAIEKIMDMYGDEIKRLVFAYLKNAADTDDVTQEVFVTIYQKLNTFQGNSTLKSWIYSIAINKCKDYLRSWHARNKRLREKLITSSHTQKKEEITPEELTLQKDHSSELLQTVMNLPIKYREVIILFYFKDLSTKEISEVLNMNEATVRTRLNRGRLKLKDSLSAEKGGVNHG